MLIVIPQVLPRDEALALGRDLAAAEGRRVVQQALAASPLFLSAALPRRIYPPLFNRYGVGEGFGDHIDNAIRVDPASGEQLRSDLSATLFLSDDYDGGELEIESDFGRVGYKPPAGDMVLYPSTSLHRVTCVTRGERIASFMWIESLVRDGAAREALFDLDRSIQALTAERGGDDAQVLRLTKVYHNLVRRWA
jgi:PKHD-type hydroxylase